MRKALWLILLFIMTAHSNAQNQIVDMKTLIGRKAIAQRMPFYQPGTYKEISRDYAGQEVTIIAVKPSATFSSMTFLTASVLSRMPPESRASIENLKNAATLIVQFRDGTKADTGASPVMPSMLSSYLELLPDPQPATELSNLSTAIPAAAIAPPSSGATPTPAAQSAATPLIGTSAIA